MKNDHHSNALLVELLIVVLFFMLASTVLLQLFAAARSQGERAEALTAANERAQNIAERLYASPSAETLAELGFSQDGGKWISADGQLTTVVELDQTGSDAGRMNRYTVSVFSADELLLTLPGARYEEGAA